MQKSSHHKMLIQVKEISLYIIMLKHIRRLAYLLRYCGKKNTKSWDVVESTSFYLSGWSLSRMKDFNSLSI